MQDVCLKTHRQVGHGTIGLRENSNFARLQQARTSNSDMAACRFLGYCIDTEMAKMDNKDLREKRANTVTMFAIGKVTTER